MPTLIVLFLVSWRNKYGVTGLNWLF